MSRAETCRISMVALLAAFLTPCPGLSDPMPEVTRSLRGDFQNKIYTADPVTPYVEYESLELHTSLTCDKIHEPPQAPSSGCPNESGVFLINQSIGQMVGSTVPASMFISQALEQAQSRLYYREADDVLEDDIASGKFSKDLAAFRYMDLLYGSDPTDPGTIVNLLEASDPSTSFSDWYGSAERVRITEAEQRLREALKFAPYDGSLRQALLDLYYNQAVAEAQFYKEALVNLAKIRFIDARDPALLSLDEEIDELWFALGSIGVPGGVRHALNGYFELLRDPMGVELTALEPAAPSGTPFGYYVFQQDVPGRSQYAATYLDGSNARDVLTGVEVEDPEDATQLFADFKDLALLFEMLADYSDITQRLARLLYMRGGETDIDDALALVAETQRKVYLEGNILLGIPFEPSLPDDGHASGLRPAIARWRQGIDQLISTKAIIEGNANILGFSPDFLMLAQNSGESYDTYDALRAYISSDNGPKERAETAQGEARSAYTSYRGNQDQLAQQFQSRWSQYNSRLLQIVGAHYCNETGLDCTGQNPDLDGRYYDSPEDNEGGEIYLQLQSIERAANRILAATAQEENLYRQIEIEIDRRGQEKGIEHAIQQVVLDYGDKQAALTRRIAKKRAEAAAANSAASSISSFSAENTLVAWLGALAHAANGAFQYINEVAIGDLQAEKETLAAQERATIMSLQGDILDVNSAARIKTWLLQAETLSLDVKEMWILMAQETSRLSNLLLEQQDLERKLASEREFLADRYFADPIHRLQMQNAMVDAQFTFETLQKWVYFLSRALEYKWNFPFAHTDEHGRTWETASVFRVRNTDELLNMLAAMDEFNALEQFTLAKDDKIDWFSIREDFMGYKLIEDGNVVQYADPDTGQTLNAIQAFRRELTNNQDESGNIVLDFSTVRELAGTSFFRGPRFLPDGTLIDPGLFLDKIVWLKIKIPGSHSLGRTQITGSLTYGGTSFIRNWDVGEVVNLDRPDLVSGEMTAWPTRYWFFHAPSDSWRFSEALTATVSMELGEDDDVPPSTQEINVFSERSVATTGWRLVVPTEDLGVSILNIDEIDDILIYFYHYAVDRVDVGN